MKVELLICLIFLCSVSIGASSANIPIYQFVEEWHLWKSTHGKSYDSHLEELERHIVWLSNKVYVEQHNIHARTGFYSYEMKLNHLADMTELEYREKYLTYKRMNMAAIKEKADKVKLYSPPKITYWPNSMDWRRKAAVTKVKNQMNCGASYAFAVAGALEGIYALTFDRRATGLSEQNIIDCSVPDGNNGCKGGNMYNSYMYIIYNDGLDSSSSYSYKGMQSPCNFTYGAVAATMTSMIVISSGNEQHLQAAVTYTGPVTAAVDAQTTGFRFYSQGVFDSSRCSNFDVNHAMLVVGYGTSYVNGISEDYWILKNSWGEDWGEDGYIRMSRNRYNQCGIASDCSYPSL